VFWSFYPFCCSTSQQLPSCSVSQNHQRYRLSRKAGSLTQVTPSSCILQQCEPSRRPEASIDVSSASYLLQCSNVTFSCRSALYNRYTALHGIQPKLFMIKEVQTQVFPATSCNCPDMSIASTTPDCILTLRDDISIAATSARLHGLLAQHQFSHKP
jgi:hypothetical protein